ncbi:hypothetical protein NE848_05785 [Gramella jeungdoensis]|uniref:Uncharacterized protein n=1 Tax=Gramella jeungdoensis TaxID=708091 RepID=A0ABT0YZH8_9FLAO|nr:hypothetical protein [Gramella jeungdoensis]MCM8568878.1 hypothetical protein [Gramella jeungdoensis]
MRTKSNIHKIHDEFLTYVKYRDEYSIEEKKEILEYFKTEIRNREI